MRKLLKWAGRALAMGALMAVAFVAVNAVAAFAQAVVDTGGAKIHGVTASQVRAVFDGNVVMFMLAWGIVHKYVPALKNVPNALIPWVNLGGYILASLAGYGATAAHAGALTGIVGTIPDAVGVLIGGFANASWARLLYEGWGKSLLEGLLHITPAAPTPPAAAAA